MKFAWVFFAVLVVVALADDDDDEESRIASQEWTINFRNQVEQQMEEEEEEEEEDEEEEEEQEEEEEEQEEEKAIETNIIISKTNIDTPDIFRIQPRPSTNGLVNLVSSDTRGIQGRTRGTSQAKRNYFTSTSHHSGGFGIQTGIGGHPGNAIHGGSPGNAILGTSLGNAIHGAIGTAIHGAPGVPIHAGPPGFVSGIGSAGLSQTIVSSPAAPPSACRYWCRTPKGQAYCCENVHQPQSFVGIVKPGQCPPVRPVCPPVRSFSPPSTCSNDGACNGIDKCCYDVCLEEHVCKPPLGIGR